MKQHYCSPLIWIGFVVIALTVKLIFSIDLPAQSRIEAELKISKQNQSDELIGGLIDKSKLKLGFLNNGRFCPPAAFLPDLPNAVSDKKGYLELLDLWIGIPDGPWTPKVWNVDSQKYVSSGPTVSGTVFEPYISGTDWSTINMTEGILYTGDLLFSDVCPPSQLFDFILSPTSDYEQTWPRNSFTGYREWPGRWKSDPLTGKPMTGSFLGDQDVFISFDDKTLADQYYPLWNLYNFRSQRGYPIGVEVLTQVVGFENSVISNFILFDMQIINTSDWDYSDVYIGLFCCSPVYWMKTGYLKNEYSVENNEIFPYNLCYYYPSDASLQRQWFGVQLLRTPQAGTDQVDKDGDGAIDESEGEELGLTGWHYFGEDNFNYFGARERLQYQVLAGDTTGLDRLIDYTCFFADSSGQLDPNFDAPARLRYRFVPRNRRGMLNQVKNLSSCGPIQLASRDTLNIAFAIMAAADFTQLKASARLARKIIDNNYHISDAPPEPKVTAVPLNDKVILYWDRSAETASDQLTGYQDFEGYKIYRTTKAPIDNEWGQAILDDKGNFINFLPLARCDLNNGIAGFENIYPFQYLGDDSGLYHTWTDTSITNGVTYWYSVCSYDHGIQADGKLNPMHYPVSPMTECNKGTDTEKDINLVKVIPGSQAANMSIPTIRIEPAASTAGNGPIEATIIDPYIITDHTYRMTFEDTTFGYAVYDLYDETLGKMLVEKVKQTNGEEGILFDGLQLFVQRYNDLEILDEKSFWYKFDTGKPSQCTWKIMGGRLTMDPNPFEYEIRFIDHFETGVITGKTAPFQIWNTVLNKKCAWDIYFNSQADTTDSLKNTWSSGDVIYIWDDFGGDHPFTLRIIITEFSYYSYQGRIDIPPQAGDVCHIVLKRPFRNGDQFRIITTAMQKKDIDQSTQQEIKVVPNPFIVQAGWELSGNESKIQFINLPSECKIHIFSLAGDRVKTLVHNDSATNYEFWDLLNNSNLKVSYGLYMFVVERPDGGTTRGKFVILR